MLRAAQIIREITHCAINCLYCQFSVNIGIKFYELCETLQCRRFSVIINWFLSIFLQLVRRKEAWEFFYWWAVILLILKLLMCWLHLLYIVYITLQSNWKRRCSSLKYSLEFKFMQLPQFNLHCTLIEFQPRNWDHHIFSLKLAKVTNYADS